MLQLCYIMHDCSGVLPGAPDLKVTGGEVVFDHVTFAYDEARPILHLPAFGI